MTRTTISFTRDRMQLDSRSGANAKLKRLAVRPRSRADARDHAGEPPAHYRPRSGAPRVAQSVVNSGAPNTAADLIENEQGRSPTVPAALTLQHPRTRGCLGDRSRRDFRVRSSKHLMGTIASRHRPATNEPETDQRRRRSPQAADPGARARSITTYVIYSCNRNGETLDR